MGLLERVFGDPAAPASASEAECWIAPGQVVEVAGRTIGGGLFYLGQGLPPLEGGGWLDTEPALINPVLRVAAPHRSRRREFGFAFTYAELKPPERGAYLDWLAGERRLAAAGSFFELYLSGLERRIFFGRSDSDDPDGDWHAITGELNRLCAEEAPDYGHQYRVAELAKYLRSLGLLTGTQTPTPPTERGEWPVPEALRMQLGRLAGAGEPLPSEWALSWVRCSHEAAPRTPAHRLPDEFGNLFRTRYRERFGEGLALPTGGPTIELAYRTVNYGLPNVVTSTSLPDVAQRPRVVEPLRELGLACCDELDPLSRWLGRNPGERNSFKAVALLPPSLLEHAESPQLLRLRELLSDASAGETPWLIDTSSLVELWDPGAEKLPKKDAVLLLQLIERLGFGLEPDPRFGGPPLAGEKAVLFPPGPNPPRTPSSAYAAATLLLHLLTAVAAADGTVSEAEERQLESHIHGLTGLFDGERERLHAHADWLVIAQPKLTRIKKKVEGLDERQRVALAGSLIAVAIADGHVDPEEVKTLEKAFKLLGLDPDSVFSELHAASSGDAVGPVVVREGSGGPVEHPIPSEEVKSPGELSRDAIDRKIEETAMVSTLLSDIFDDDEQDAPDQSAVAADGEAEQAGIDGAHVELAAALAERSTWSRSEVETLASDLQLMVDGAIETINDAAFDRCDAPFTEGEDPIEIDLEVAKEMLE